MTRVWDRESDYQELARWWKAHDWEAIPSEDLPDTGYIANETAFGCLYIDIHMRFAMLEWIVTNPDESTIKCYKSINEVIDKLMETAASLGVKRVYSALKHEGLIRLYEKHGFIKGDTNICDMIWIGG